MIYDTTIYALLDDVSGIKKTMETLTDLARGMVCPSQYEEEDCKNRCAADLKYCQPLARDQLEILREYAMVLKNKCDAIIAEAENAGQLSIDEIKALANLPVDEKPSFE